jgi:type IV pilus assembly protein PilO
MTNFQAGQARRLTREQVLLFAPVVLGVLLAATAGGLLLWPALQQLQRDQEQLTALKEQEARLPLLRQQLTKQRENLDLAREKGQRILQLIAGSGDISTFIAQLGQEATRSGVQLNSYEPLITSGDQAAQAKPAAKKPGKASSEKQDQNKPPPPPPDPLLAPGLQKTTLLISAQGSGPQLRDFLRRLERLSLLVVQSDLSLKTGSPTPPASGFTALKLNLSLYSKALARSAAETAGNAPAPAAAKP